jgi:hypothetical protein
MSWRIHFLADSFTPDGHLVGSIGESLAAYMFDLGLMPASDRGFDARSTAGLTVEIKATQTKSIALSAHVDPLPALRKSVGFGGFWDDRRLDRFEQIPVGLPGVEQ